MATSSATCVPKPRKFDAQCEITTWTKQFELYLRLTKVPVDQKKDMLLAYLDYDVFEAVNTGLDSDNSDYDKHIQFLTSRYSSIDTYLEHIAFIDAKYNSAPEEFAAQLSKKFDQFSTTYDQLREELLVAKFISASNSSLASELRLRRPTTMNDCVQIANSVQGSSMNIMAFKTTKQFHHDSGIKQHEKQQHGKICFRCGSNRHIASDASCPAKSAKCHKCSKIGHFSKVCKSSTAPSVSTIIHAEMGGMCVSSLSATRPTITVLLNNEHSVEFIVDTGAEISVLSQKDFSPMTSTCALQSVSGSFKSVDNSPVNMLGCLPSSSLQFNNKHADVNLYVASLPHSILGMDAISGLRLTIRTQDVAAVKASAVTNMETSKISAADCLSRLPAEEVTDDMDFEITLAALHSNLKVVTSTDLQSATANDPALQTLLSFISNGWPLDLSTCPELIPYRRFKDEFTSDNGIILRGDKIVVPDTLQYRILQLAHDGHFGMAKTKARIRQSYWWVQLDKEVENMIRQCHCCKLIPRDSPVQVTEWNLQPWTELAIDIAGPKYIRGTPVYLIALIDLHSKFVQCTVTSKTVTTRDIIQFLESSFTTFGYCAKLIADNGSQFSSAAFKEYLSQHGINLVHSAVYNPQSNGAIERVNKNLKKLLDTAKQDNVSINEFHQTVSSYLLNYNNTPHGTTAVRPSHLIFRYKPRTPLDVVTSTPPTQEANDIKTRVQCKLQQRADYANARRRPLQSPTFRVGDWVQKPPGPIRQIVKQCGTYTYELNDGYKVNARRLKLIRRAEPVEYATVSHENRYPQRVRRQTQRFDPGKM